MSELNKNSLIERLKISPDGVVDLKDLGPLYLYDPKCEYLIDKNGVPVKQDYLCSFIISIRKYSLGKYSVSTVPLKTDYNGENVRKTLKYMNAEWNIATMSLVSISEAKISGDFSEFKK